MPGIIACLLSEFCFFWFLFFSTAFATRFQLAYLARHRMNKSPIHFMGFTSSAGRYGTALAPTLESGTDSFFPRPRLLQRLLHLGGTSLLLHAYLGTRLGSPTVIRPSESLPIPVECQLPTTHNDLGPSVPFEGRDNLLPYPSPTSPANTLSPHQWLP